MKQYALELAESILASTPTEGLIEVLKLAFGKYIPKKARFPPEDDPEMYDYETEEDDGTVSSSRKHKGAEEEDDLPEGGVKSHDAEAEAAEVQQGTSQELKPGSSKTGLKRSLRSGKVSQPKRAKAECQPEDPPARYPLHSKEIAVYFPTTAKASEHHIGVADCLVSKRSKFGKTRDIWRYKCLFSSNAESVGYKLREEDEGCDFWTQQSSATVTHIRRHHLGIALGCKFCDWRTFSGASWKPHMKRFHKSTPEDQWYAHDDEEVLQGVKYEVEEISEEALVSALEQQ